MKILFIAMPSIHFIRWIENLDNSEHELFWFDVLGKGSIATLENVKQFTNWKKRRFQNIKGEYFLSKKAPNVYQKIRPFLEVTENNALESIIKEIKPDVIHSFEMQSCSYPILQTMNKFSNIKWIYSCWGSDLFYYRNQANHFPKIKAVLKRINFLHTDCMRDYTIAKELGFKGIHLGVVPGGAGYKLSELEIYKIPIEQRKIILIKGYENLFGRALNVINAIKKADINLNELEIVVFGAHPVVQNYIKENNLDIKVYGRHDLSHLDLIKLIGKSLVYIGNNISDGMPNTLLEAIVMGAFPIQSNPGGATAEIITHGENGFLIHNPEDIDTIAQLIFDAISNPDLLKKTFEINKQLAKQRLDFNINQEKILALYYQTANL